MGSILAHMFDGVKHIVFRGPKSYVGRNLPTKMLSESETKDIGKKFREAILKM